MSSSWVWRPKSGEVRDNKKAIRRNERGFMGMAELAVVYKNTKLLNVVVIML